MPIPRCPLCGGKLNGTAVVNDIEFMMCWECEDDTGSGEFNYNELKDVYNYLMTPYMTTYKKYQIMKQELYRQRPGNIKYYNERLKEWRVR